MNSVRLSAASQKGLQAFAIISVLILITGIDRFIIRVGGTNFRVELVVGGVALLGGLLILGKSARHSLGIVEYLVLGWLALNFASSLLFAPDTVASLRMCILLTGLVVLFFATLLPLRTREGVYWASVLWASIGAGIVFLGLVQGLLFTFFGITTGMHFNRSYIDGIFSAVPMVTGTVWEPNLFGSYALSVALVSAGLAFSLHSVTRAWQLRFHVATAIGFAGAIVSMTRTVWLVAIIMSVVLVISSVWIGILRPYTRLAKSAAAIGAGAAIGVLIALTLPKISWATENPGALTIVEVAERAGMGVRGEPITGADVGTSVQHDSALADRAGELAAVDQVPSLLIRQEVMVNSFKGWLQRPLLGWGTGSYPQVFVIAPGAPNWIPNIFMHVLFDTGIAGFLLFGGALGISVFRALARMREPVSGWVSADFATYGLLLATIALILTYQLTDGTWMGFTWVLLALLVAAGKDDRSTNRVGQ